MTDKPICDLKDCKYNSEGNCNKVDKSDRIKEDRKYWMYDCCPYTKTKKLLDVFVNHNANMQNCGNCCNYGNDKMCLTCSKMSNWILQGYEDSADK